MDTLEQIKKEKQTIAKGEQSLALAKLRKRRADTRHKIELGGLVIKAGIGCYNKSFILGALIYINNLISDDLMYQKYFEYLGNNLFNGIYEK